MAMSLLHLPAVDGGPILKWASVDRGHTVEQADEAVRKTDGALAAAFSIGSILALRRRRNPMTHLPDMEKSRAVRSMFARIAKRYDRMNRLMSWGQDARWRREAINLADLPRGARLLDIGTGTGDMAFEALRGDESLLAVGGDFTVEMMRQGQKRVGGERIRWTGTDALNLPFPAETFTVVTSGYLMRNVADVRRAWSEHYRVLKPGGQAVCLDLTRPSRSLLRPFVHFYMHRVVPALGGLVAGAREAYRYLPDSVEDFLSAEELAECMKDAGFQKVAFRRLMLDTMALHWARK